MWSMCREGNIIGVLWQTKTVGWFGEAANGLILKDFTRLQKHDYFFSNVIQTTRPFEQENDKVRFVS